MCRCWLFTLVVLGVAGCGGDPRTETRTMPSTGQGQAPGVERGSSASGRGAPGPNADSAAASARRTQSTHRIAGGPPLQLPLVNPRIVVKKGRRELQLFSNGILIRTYRVGLGLNPTDDKTKEGDRCTPEGEFYVCLKNPKSKFYLSLCISYPNAEDAERGLRDGLITQADYHAIVEAIQELRVPPQKTPLGGEICIHGAGAHADWTLGCVALDNAGMQELFEAIHLETVVVIER